MIKLADTLAPMSNDFYAVESENVGIDIDGTSKSIQQAYEDGDLSGGGSSIQVDTMPIASVDELGKIYEFIGSTGTYVNGYFYECVSDEQNPPTYSWVQKNVQPNAESFTFNEDDFNVDSSTDEVSLLPSRRVFNGSKADWDLLSVAEKTQYGATAFTDDEGGGMSSPVDVVESGNMHAVTSNAVAQITSNHNGIFRGKCLNGSAGTMYPTLPIGNTKNLPGGGYTIEQVLTNIAAGNFADIYIGDYFIDSNNKVYRIACLDTEWNKGETPVTSHHAVIVTDFALTNIGWNPTNTTAGGYQVSAVQAYCDRAGQTAIEGVFGAAHVLTVRDLLSSDMNASAASPGYSAWQGVASSWEWSSHKVRLMSEVEVYGSRVFSGGFDIGTANEQFPLFRLMPQLATGLRYDYWLSGIASAVNACYVNGTGRAGITNPSIVLGVRVRFLVG